MTSDFCAELLQSGAIFSLDDRSVLVGWGPSKATSEQPTTEDPAFYFPDFFLSDKAPWHTYAQWKQLSIADLLAKLQHVCAPVPKPLPWRPADKERFKIIFDELQQLFAVGRLYKAVPYLFEECQTHFSFDQRLATLLNVLQRAQEQPVHLYGFWGPSCGIFGATPEILFRSKLDSADQRCLQTMACAGTQSIGSNESDFLCDPKQCDEHRHVIQGIKQSLTLLGGSVSIEPTRVLKLAQLLHLVTPIQAQLTNAISFESIVRALHPTPALGAVPRQAGAVWLEAYQQSQPRYRFGAPAGVVFPVEQRWDCLVAIRNVQWHGDWAGIAAGCGIVAASDFESEWQELCLKVRSTKEMLSL